MEQRGTASDRSTVHQAARDLYVNTSPSPRPGLATLVVPEEVTHPVRGRDDLLADLAAAVEPGGQVVVLHGNGGHGKTTVAVQFARHVGVEVWWVDASSATNVTEGLREVALRAGADGRTVRNAWSGASSAPEVLWRALDVRAEPWLLVLDNADDPQALAPNGERVATGRGWLRTPKSTGTVLITSRDGRRSEWGDRTFIPVGVLAPGEAARVLLDLAPGAGTGPDARDLAERLGGLPLGLRLAGHYLRSTSQAIRLPGMVQPRTFAEYGQALADGAEPGGHETLAGTWELSLDLLAKRGRPLARPLLRLLSTFAPAPIPVELLDASVLAGSEVFAGITPQRLTDLVEALLSLGLVDHRADALVLHPLVRDANLRQASGYDDLRSDMVQQVLLGLDPSDPRTWSLWRALLPNALRLPDSPVHVLVSVAVFCFEAGLETEAWHLIKRLRPIYVAKFGADHEFTLGFNHLMAQMADYRGEPEVARRVRELGVLRRSGASTDRQAQARDLVGQGRYAEALAEWSDMAEEQRTALGDEHPQTLSARQQVLAMLVTLRRFDRAEVEALALVPIHLRVFGPDHRDTLAMRALFALACDGQGRSEVAVSELRDVLARCARSLGPEHSVTLAVRGTLDAVLEALANPSP